LNVFYLRAGVVATLLKRELKREIGDFSFSESLGEMHVSSKAVE